ncbi:MAG: hypothetical protein FWC68_01450, partial [Oscillospiraceae bacterium]|nr:hypothetical protein [Oscillospiraceae bacterium]
MSFLANKKWAKRIAIILIVITLFTFIMPVTSNASTFGAANLVRPIFQFVVFLGDLTIGWLQYTFMGVRDIRIETPLMGVSDTFIIRYSPGVIFSGDVPGLDVNFMSPMSPTRTRRANEWREENASTVGWAIDNRGLPEGYLEEPIRHLRPYNFQQQEDVIILWTDPDTETEHMFVSYRRRGEHVGAPITREVGGRLFALHAPAGEEYGRERESIAGILQTTISTWYITLRAIAFVGLLSVLVYTGIKILLTSVAEDKAKY